MARHLVHKGGSVLAALAIIAGGAIFGAGGAGAASTGIAWPGSSTPPCGPQGGLLGCDDRIFQDIEQVGNIRLEYIGPDKVDVGSEVMFSQSFSARASDQSDALLNVAVESVTHHAPRGFEFVGAKVIAHIPSGNPDGTKNTELDSTAAVDPITGDVTITAPTGGWAMQTPATNGGASSISVQLSYRVTELILDGTSGVRFTGTGVPASEGWMATGTTQYAPGVDGFGS